MSGTKYPAAIDDNTSLVLSTDLVTPVKSQVPNDLRSAILAIETELGIDPSQVYATVRARLDALAAAVNGQGSVIGGLAPNSAVITSLGGTLTTLSLPGQQYAVFMENPIGTISWTKMSLDMLSPSFAITLSGGFALEVGATLTTPAFTATYTTSPTSVILTDSDASPPKDVSGTPNSFNANFTTTKNTVGATKICTITASNGIVSKTANTTFTWEQKHYHGVGTAGQTTAAFILSLIGTLSLVQPNTFTVTAGATQKIYFASRAAFGTPTFTVGGFSGGFNLVSNVISVTNLSGITENYQLWESTNVNLGLTTVVVT